MVKKIDRETMVVGAGAGIGVIQTVLMKEYVDSEFGPIPYISDFIPDPWARWSTFGNIVLGGVAFGLTTFTNLVKNYDVNKFFQIYGMTTLIGGIMNGIFPGPTLGYKATRTAALVAPRTTVTRVAPQTPTGIPATRVLA